MIVSINNSIKLVQAFNECSALKQKNIFSLIESYLVHIRNQVNRENNIQYHQDLSKILELMN